MRLSGSLEKSLVRSSHFQKEFFLPVFQCAVDFQSPRPNSPICPNFEERHFTEPFESESFILLHPDGDWIGFIGLSSRFRWTPDYSRSCAVDRVGRTDVAKEQSTRFHHRKSSGATLKPLLPPPSNVMALENGRTHGVGSECREYSEATCV